jgi:hypothetical protein
MLKEEKTPGKPLPVPSPKKDPVLKKEPAVEAKPKSKPTGDLFCCSECKDIFPAVAMSNAYPGMCISCGQEKYVKECRTPYEKMRGEKKAEIFALEFHEVPSTGKGTMIDVDINADGTYTSMVDVLILKIGDQFVELGWEELYLYLTVRGTKEPEKKDGVWIWPKEKEGGAT